SGIVGYRFLYTYANGWIYELYVKNATTIDYRIHTGHVGGRWVRDQSVDLVQLCDDVFKISWTEPTGTSVVVNILPGLRRIHGTIFFPAWIAQDGSKTVVFQNEHLELMRASRRRPHVSDQGRPRVRRHPPHRVHGTGQRGRDRDRSGEPAQ
ncbi:MAG: phenolic acid decarboxylase, partial [Propionicimonas sp.]